MKLCTVDGCGKAARARGWCNAHYRRWLRCGDPLAEVHGRGARWLVDAIAHHHTDSCLIWPFARNSAGYGHFYEGDLHVFAHGRACEMAHGPRPTPHHEAAHSCGKGALGCVAPAHLRWATPSENAMDRALHGTANRGEQHGLHKLSDADVRFIRDEGRSIGANTLSEMFGVSASNIYLIWARTTWAWLD